MEVVFKVGDISFKAKFNNSKASGKIKNNLPLESEVEIWGDEIYFEIGLEASTEGKTIDVNIGDVVYWPQGKCLCVFYGPTPASKDKKPMPASSVVIVGKTDTSPEILRKIKAGEKIIVEKL